MNEEYCADDEYALENTALQNDTSGSSSYW